MEEIVFHHTLPIQLRFNDVDKFGHVNNTVYFSFYDLGKTEYFASVCPGVDWEKTGIVVVHIEADFVKQIFASDHIAVQTAVSEVGTKSFHLLQRVIDTKTNEIKCICKSIMVTFDLERHESMPLTEEITGQPMPGEPSMMATSVSGACWNSASFTAVTSLPELPRPIRSSAVENTRSPE